MHTHTKKGAHAPKITIEPIESEEDQIHRLIIAKTAIIFELSQTGLDPESCLELRNETADLLALLNRYHPCPPA